MTLKDIHEADLESRLRKISIPCFLVSVPNTKEDTLGTLRLFKKYLHFIPLNPYLKGEFKYNGKEPLAKTDILEFKICYTDISDEEPVIMPMPSTETDKLDDFPINFSCLLTLFRTGYYFYAEDEEKKIIDDFKKNKNLGIATVVLKIPSFDLMAKKRNNDQREGIANQIFSELMRKKGHFEAEIERKGLEYPKGELTTISTFDIIYENIFPELEEQEGSKIDNVDKHILDLKKIFGYTQIKSVKNINNQCLFPLEFTFPELGKQIEMEELISRKGGFLKDYTLLDHTEGVFDIPSKILSLESVGKIKEDFPYYLKTSGWIRLYSMADDGASIRT